MHSSFAMFPLGSRDVVRQRNLASLLLALSSVIIAFACGGKSSPPSNGNGGTDSAGSAGASTERTGRVSSTAAAGGISANGGGSGSGGIPAPTGGAGSLPTSNTLLGSGGSGTGSTSATSSAPVVATGGDTHSPTGGSELGGRSALTGGVSSGGSSIASSAKPTGGSVSATGGTGIGGTSATGGTSHLDAGGTSAGGGNGPCDIYAAAVPPTPCVAAYSMIRLLNSKYDGPLYQVRRGGSDAGSDVKDIGFTASGFADSATQDAFCGTDACTVSILYDQSGKGNHLTSSPQSCYTGTANVPANESNAKGRSLQVGGHKVYALYMVAKDGYRNNKTTAMPIGDESQGIYEVVDGKRFGDACCWDFGNATTNNCDGPVGSLNALFFGVGYWGTGAGDGPWFMADFDRGVWSGGSGVSTITNPDNPPVTSDFAMGILKTNSTNYALRVGDVQSGILVTAYDGALPFSAWSMHGGIVLGIDSAVSFASYGTFFEGAITSGRPSDATEAAVMANVKMTNYGK